MDNSQRAINTPLNSTGRPGRPEKTSGKNKKLCHKMPLLYEIYTMRCVFSNLIAG